eukprot:CAMPEP_0197027132 /NCGR_PEP_ID=MMETSP1384-20130603/7098_1 /TAXON_ID=29189 /ORGANISM="Ammonia sp." /LENGTH=334 /DNA_ID=CAMNT_0042455931 /DNA_START=59 /DNA_END=1063 /DNA_ORIENTATION=-
MGACHSLGSSISESTSCYTSASTLQAIKKERRILLVGLTPSVERDFLCKLQSILHANLKSFSSSYNNDPPIQTQYNHGELIVHESTPHSLRAHSMKHLDDNAYFKLLRHWKCINYECLIQGWFRANCDIDSFPVDIVKYMKRFCCIPSVDVHSFKMQLAADYLRSKQVINVWNISGIYRKCWSLQNNKQCFRHKELSYCFKSCAAVLFLVDLACYDQMDDKTKGNKMNRTIKLFQWFLKDFSLYLKKQKVRTGQVLLVFDQMHQFVEKLTNHGIDISRCYSFNKYDGPPRDVDAIKQYIVAKFHSLNLYSCIKLTAYFNDEDMPKYLRKINNLC